MKLTKNDKEILRSLAHTVADISQLPIQKETKLNWKALNSLKPVRPMFNISQMPWHELDYENELKLRCEDEYCKTIEQTLRRIVYKSKHICDDAVVEPHFDVTKALKGFSFGMDRKENISISDPDNSVVGHQYIDQLMDEEDLVKIKKPVIDEDKQTTMMRMDIVNDAFGDILKIRSMGITPNFAAWDRIAEWHGIQGILYDLIDRPEFMHKIIDRTTEVFLSMLEQLDEKGLLAYDQAVIHCSGAYTDELPAEGFDQQKPRAKDIWTCGMAQIFSTVSPAMHDEFEVEYAVKWYKHFGLVYYGCCEPLHKKIDILRRIPNLKKISMSPWINIEEGSMAIGKDYVFSRKPNPAFVAESGWDKDFIRKELEDTLKTCARHGNPLEFILKDISTVKYQPKRLWEWAEVAAQVCGKQL